MKKVSLALFAALFGAFSYAQEIDSTGLEGDNLDLNGVLELFKESDDVEDFEKKLNTESNGVNNLDLNDDGEVDYIRVVDHADSNAHSLALQVPVNENESQDVAVIEMEEVEEDKVNLQVIGDSELYGEEYMVEPADEKNPNIVVNVNTWRPVRYIYGPRYVAYRSPYRWGVYPRWYRPWRRVGWAVYRPRVIRYHRPYYRRVRVRRCHRAYGFYRTRRVYSPVFYKSGKSATVIKANNKAVGVKKTTTVKKANNGTVVKKQTTTTVKKTPANTAVKKETTVKQGAKSNAIQKESTVKRGATQTKSTTTKRPGAVKQKGTQTKSTTTKRPGATKQRKTTTKSRTTTTRKGRR
jgi:hypothetical protein